jgi:FkbM family methyltransferase
VQGTRHLRSDLRRKVLPALPSRGRRRALLRRAFSNWWLPANLGSVAYRLRGFAPGLFRAAMEARFSMRTRSGSRLQARLRDLDAPAEVFGLEEYDFAVIDWSRVEHIVDLGAHVGSFVLWSAERTAARVFAVDPNVEVVGLLRANVLAAGLGDRVTVRQAAVGGRPGEARLVLANDTAATSVALDGTGPRVDVITLDQVFEESGFTHVDILKMDIEGAEYGALTAVGRELLERVQVAIIECHLGSRDGFEDLSSRFEAIGFSVAVEPKSANQSLLIAWR